MPRGGSRGGGSRGGSPSRSSGGGFFGRSSPQRAPAAAPRAPAPAPKAAAPTPAPAQSGGMFGGGGGLMSTMATGMAFGAGSEIAHQGVRAMMGGGGSGSGHSEPQQQQEAPPQQQYAPQQPMYAQEQPMQAQGPCADFSQKLMSCLQTNQGQSNYCSNYMDMLNQCETDHSRFANQQM